MTDDALSPVTRISVGVIPKAASELAVLQAQTGMSKTELINRAISLYAFVEDEHAAGRQLKVHDPATGVTETVRFL